MHASSLLVVAFVGALIGFAPARAAPLSVADAFRGTPVLSMQLSPDGRRLLALGWTGKGTGAAIMEVATMTPKVLKGPGERRPVLTSWLGAQLVVVGFADGVHIHDSSGNFIRAVEGRFVAPLPPDAQGHERIVTAIGRDFVSQVDVRDGRATRIPFDWPAGNRLRWLMDREGVPRVATTSSSDGTILTHWHRPSAGEPWQALESQLAVDSRWQPIALTRDGRSLLVFSAEGRNTMALFRYSIEERALKEMLAGHPTEDIGLAQERAYASEGGAEDAETNYVRVITMGMKSSVHWLDAKMAALQQAVDAALPGRVNRVSGNLKAGRVLVYSEGDVDPGTWYLLELPAMSLRVVEVRKREIDRKAMLPMQIVRYRSHDGLEIPAYLTLPAGGGRNLPAVVLVHGGPMVRDRWAWNAEVQMLASRGYAVLQPQFRGSVGFGKSFEHAGYREWGRSMQDDVSAGAEWLAAQGIADAQRICIYGASYGGYAALWALAKTPKLFRCGASIAGVSDLGLMFLARSDVNRTELGRLFQLRTIGDHQVDSKRLEEVSPLLHADRIVAPVLIGHGEKDERVPIVHAQNMVAALKAHGKDVEWIELKGEGHGIADAGNRERFYDALFKFLARNTAPRDAAAPATTSLPAAAPVAPASLEPGASRLN